MKTEGASLLAVLSLCLACSGGMPARSGTGHDAGSTGTVDTAGVRSSGETGGGGAGGATGAPVQSGNVASATSIKNLSYVLRMLKGYTENRFVLKFADAQQVSKLNVTWDGKRPAGYETNRLEGSIILGTGGDGSDGASGTFWEGAMTAGVPLDSTDDAIQANIAAAGYGK